MKKILIGLLSLGWISSSYAQEPLTYQEPPKSIVDLVDAPQTPQVRFNQDGSKMLILQVPGFTSIEEISQPVLGLAGLKVKPSNSTLAAESQGVFIGISVKDVHSGEVSEIQGLPDVLRMDNISWSPDERYIAFTNSTLEGVELWVLDVEAKTAKRLGNAYLNKIYGRTLQWHPDGTSILAQYIPERGPEPKENPVPTGPIIQENLGETTPSRTYQYLLENPYDETLMDYYLRTQLVEVKLDGQETRIGAPAIYRTVNYSPDGAYLLVQTVERPYSYLVPISYFPYTTRILDAQGNQVKELYATPLADKRPIGFDMVSPGPRSYSWRGDQPATVVWVEALDEGNSKNQVETRDALYSLAAPFQSEPTRFFATQYRYSSIAWVNSDYAIVSERWRRTRKSKMTLINPNDGEVVKVISDRSYEDTYTDPGRFVYTSGPYDQNVVLLDKGKNPVVFTRGQGASSVGDRPFLLRWDLMKDQVDTLFHSKAPYYEYPAFFNNDGRVIISRESSDMPPNFVSINLKNQKESNLTDFPYPYPSLEGVQKSLISYPRKDGITLSAQLYLPKGYTKADGPLPVLIWAYPREYKSREAAAQVKGSPYRFTRLAFRSPVYWVTRGYAVLDNADMPIVGLGDDQPNDTFVEQVIENAHAVIDYVVDQGIGDRNRIAVGGHSYGAFMTANLLAHTDLFAAGIARSGAYNRTLTPFGFQAEPRTFWEAPEVYGRMSPFNYADRIKTPLLMTHGIDDDNSGTFPVQSERLYAAIKGHGGTVRLVMLPKEFHGYRSRESILHTYWEQDQWLETYVKHRK